MSSKSRRGGPIHPHGRKYHLLYRNLHSLWPGCSAPIHPCRRNSRLHCRGWDAFGRSRSPLCLFCIYNIFFYLNFSFIYQLFLYKIPCKSILTFPEFLAQICWAAPQFSQFGPAIAPVSRPAKAGPLVKNEENYYKMLSSDLVCKLDAAKYPYLRNLTEVEREDQP